MQANKKIMSFLIPALLILPGCLVPQDSREVVFQLEPTEGQQSNSVAKRFQESATQGPTAIESAIELSEKYAKLSKQSAVLQQKSQHFTAENHQLKKQVAALEAQLQQTQKELAQANDLLIEMRIELNNWKIDILGFRDEMRDADTAQLQTLLKILNILGGEVKPESTQGEDKGSAPVSSEKSRPQPQKTL